MIYPEYTETYDFEKMKKKISKIEKEFEKARKLINFLFFLNF